MKWLVAAVLAALLAGCPRTGGKMAGPPDPDPKDTDGFVESDNKDGVDKLVDDEDADEETVEPAEEKERADKAEERSEQRKKTRKAKPVAVAPPPPPSRSLNTLPGLSRSASQRDAMLARQLTRASASLGRGDVDRAIVIAREILEIKSDHVDAIIVLAHAYLQKGWRAKAKRALTTGNAYADGARNARLWMMLGLVNDAADGSLIEAQTAYETAVKLKPNYVKAWNNLGAIYLRTRRFAKAIEAFENATSIDRDSVFALTNLGTAYRRRSGELSANRTKREDLLRKSERAYRAAIALDETHSPAYLNLGLLYLDADTFPGMAKLAQLQASVRYLREYRRRGWPGGVSVAQVDHYLDVAGKQLKLIERARRRTP